MKEIKNWQLFVDKFGENYSMHDAVVKRFDLNEDELVEKDAKYKNIFKFKIEDTQIVIKCFTIELVSITESEPFRRGLYLLEDEDVSPENAKIMWRS